MPFFVLAGYMVMGVISAGRRRKKKAVSLREKAKRLESQTEGIF